MAVVGYQEVTRGTAIVIGQTSASGVTVAMDVDGVLTAGVAVQSDLIDLGADHADEYEVSLEVETGSAPTAGETYDLYLVCNRASTNFPSDIGSGGTPGKGTFTLGTSDINLRQCGNIVNQLVCRAVANTVQRQQPVIWRPSGRYVVAILDNNTSQNCRDETTATDNDTRIVLTPRRSVFNS